MYGKEISLNYFRMGLKHNVSNWISASLVGFWFLSITHIFLLGQFYIVMSLVYYIHFNNSPYVKICSTFSWRLLSKMRLLVLTKRSDVQVHWYFRSAFNREPSSRSTIRYWHKKCMDTGSFCIKRALAILEVFHVLKPDDKPKRMEFAV